MLKSPPSQKHLSRMYYELSQLGAACSGAKEPWPYHPKGKEEILALGAEMSRYDPRLLGILVEYLSKHWKEISPQKFRAYYPAMQTPQTVAVIAEFVRKAVPSGEARFLMEYLQKGLRPVAPQLYFKDLYSPGGGLMQKATEQSLAQYKKWGFFGREAPTIDVFRKKTVGHMDRPSRLNLLSHLFEAKKELGIRDYLNALNYTISRQQALQDLAHVAIRKRGSSGRGTKWLLKADHK